MSNNQDKPNTVNSKPQDKPSEPPRNPRYDKFITTAGPGVTVTPPKSKPKAKGEYADTLSPQDEAALDKAWASVSKRGKALTLAIEDAQKYGSERPTPPNEASTCEWVILPLLWAIGYEPWEIVSRASDGYNSFPDYTLLPATPEYTWYLEAKAWNVVLDDKHASQALNYSHQNGKRWVVLTNGQQWRLYDDYVRGIAANKVVAQAELSNSAAITELLSALGKASVTSKGLDKYVREKEQEEERMERRQSLWQTLEDQIVQENSPAIRALYNEVRKTEGLAGIVPSDIAAFFIQYLPPSEQEESEKDSSPLTMPPKPTVPIFWQHFRQFATQHRFQSTSDRTTLWKNIYYDVKRYNGYGIFRFDVRPEGAWVELLILSDDSSTTKERFERLHAKKGQIEQAYGAPLVWECKPGLQRAKVRSHIQGGSINNPSSWPTLHQGMIEAMERLMKALAPFLTSG